MKDYYIPEVHPMANEANCIYGKNYRITLLTEKLVRLEYSEDGYFENRATQVIWNRDFVPVKYTIIRKEDGITVRTSRICITYDEKPFSNSGLAITLHGYADSAHTGGWHYGDKLRDLKGTARTLDEVNGDNVELESGLIAVEGFSVLDDSKSLIIGEDGWLLPRKENVEDLYFFGYGKDYLEAIQDFYHLSGPAPMIPRFALGNWWSRYYPYSEASYNELMNRFEQEQIPFSVAVIDMDWHIVKVDTEYGNGWTGFTWNRELFPNPEQFLETLHRRGMKVTLNLHPADGIRAYEEVYPIIATHMNVDIENKDPVLFEPDNPIFMEHYYEDVLHPMEEQGVDFWWVDWQQGNSAKLANLDPLWVLNHYGYLDNGRNGKRPMAFSRYSGPGSHRYPIGFSGDTIVTWESLQFQPYFTSTASNIGYCWWSHDIGGHMRGYKNDELVARWTQYGTFSPIQRLHSACSEFCGKEPWRYKPEAAKAMTDALRFRHQMMPYLYTMNRRCYEKGIPLILPLYYYHPNQKEGYEYDNEYYFGSELLVAPITTPRIVGINLAKEDVYIPNGIWFDIFEKRVYQGDRSISVYRDLEHIPVFAKAGSIIPLTDEISPADAQKNPTQLHICVFLGDNGSFTLYEDDNESCRYQKEEGAYTELELVEDKNTSFHIHAVKGQKEFLPAERKYIVEFIGCKDCTECLKVFVDEKEVAVHKTYDPRHHVAKIEMDYISVEKNISILLGEEVLKLKNDSEKEVFDFLNQAEIEFDCKESVYQIIQKHKNPAYALSELSAMKLPDELYGVLTELLTAYNE